jgi:hypothetical protein
MVMAGADSSQLLTCVQCVNLRHVCVLCCAVVQGGFPEIRCMLCIGGIDMRTQMDTLKKGEAGPGHTPASATSSAVGSQFARSVPGLSQQLAA